MGVCTIRFPPRHLQHLVPARSSSYRWPSAQAGETFLKSNLQAQSASTFKRSALGVRVEHVSKTFEGGVEALRSVSLSVSPGSFTALIGPSGCGKTTLLRIMGGLEKTSAGHLGYTDHSGAEVQPGKDDLAYCFQEPRLLPWRTVLGNVLLPLELRGVPANEARDRSMTLLAKVGLDGTEQLRPHQLSGGMRMRVAVARSLVTEPRILLLDEPFGSLDEITRAHLDDLLLSLWRQEAMTVILVTHAINEAVYLAQDVQIMSPRPGRNLAHEVIEFEDRKPELRRDKRYAELVAQVHLHLEQGMAENDS